MLVPIDAATIRCVREAYLTARDRGALNHTAFDCAVSAVRERFGLESSQARLAVTQILDRIDR